MPMDAVCMSAAAAEVKSAVLGARVDKVRQPTRDQIVLAMGRGFHVLLNAGGNQPRIQLTRLSRENPAQPPMFCMLLRKHLTGARLLNIEQPEMERVVTLTFEGRDEMGVSQSRSLVLEAIGRSANLILLDGEQRIMECMRRVDLDITGGSRQLLPGLFYRLPPPQAEKHSPLCTDTDTLIGLIDDVIDREILLDRFLLMTFSGLSPLLCRELVYRACGTTDARIFALDDEQKKRLCNAWMELRERIENGSFLPTMLLDGEKPVDYACVPITQYEDALQSVEYGTVWELLDDFYETRERTERMHRQSHDLRQVATAARDRLRRKIAVQEKEYAATLERDRLRKCGDLITANLYRMEKGARVLKAEDYYTEGCPEIEISLDPLLSPQQNAARYYKKYHKAKTAEEILREQIEKGRVELEYLESVLESLREAESEQDLREIRGELKNGGYLRSGKSEKKQPSAPSKPREFRTDTGFRISVGRSNSQNDRLTMKLSAPDDIWFHTQKIHGAHVILHTEGKTPDAQSMTQAASLAAYYSRAREGKNVPVDYTPVRYVKKPSGSKPGMVIYTTYQTAYVTPDEQAVKALRGK